MARLFGFIGNRIELGAQLLQRHGSQLKVDNAEKAELGWGVGFYQGGEVLLRRRPRDTRAELVLADFAEDTKTDVLIGHVRKPTVGGLRTENTHPFRYRQWLFAQTGTVQHFERIRDPLTAGLPGFLSPNVRGETDSEVLFYLALSSLLAEGELESHITAPERIRDALRSAFDRVELACADHGAVWHKGDALLSNGETLVAAHHGSQMAYTQVETPEDVASLLAAAQENTVDPALAKKLNQARCCVVASKLSQLPDGWVPVEKNSFLTLGRTCPPHFERV